MASISILWYTYPCRTARTYFTGSKERTNSEKLCGEVIGVDTWDLKDIVLCKEVGFCPTSTNVVHSKVYGVHRTSSCYTL